jgi:hypothetical protein
MTELEHLYTALNSKWGIVVQVAPQEYLKTAIQRLYAARRKAFDPALEVLQIRKSPIAPTSELWIVKLRQEEEQEQPPLDHST